MEKETESITLGSKSTIVEKQNVSENTPKLSNQWGIVGFVMAVVFPIYAKTYATSSLISDIVFITFLLIATAISIYGVSRDEKKYQKGIANFGMLLNIILLVFVGIMVYNGYKMEEPKESYQTHGTEFVH